MAKLIAVRPRNYRSIALQAIELAEKPIVFMDKKPVTDFSDRGPLVQKQIRQSLDFVIRDGHNKIVGFHEHPDEMWIAEAYYEYALFCENQGWLKIQHIP